ncbi:DUF5047 domain-containing protein [Saxibacter everestensis]|uniref:DUF5047 domain-containing protein n=1 Tax=Saxibacter everestensis TaxID=2909229 RepID=A0ABY8QWW7_9MICO|nr:DUF5047 domain-containing protein [Brevibacteriaceae bacterium ZFBP1038]
MQPVTERWLASLALARWIPRVEWSPDRGVTWLPLTLHDGSATADSKSQVRWSSTLTCSGADVGRHGLSPFGSRVRIHMGLAYDRHTVEEVRLGTYRVEDLDQTGVRPGRFTIKCASLEAQVMDARFQRARSFPAGPSRFLLEQLIREVLPEASIQWQVGDLDIPQLTEERDRWGLIDGRSDAASIAKSLGARVFADARGVFTVAPVPSLEDKPAWTVDVGPGGMLVEPSSSLSRKGVYNQVVARGSRDDGTPPVGPVTVSDTDPTSPTYVNTDATSDDKGPFGEVPMFYTSQLLKTIAQCEKAAKGLLAPRLGLKQTASIKTLTNFALEPDDVIDARQPDGSMAPTIVDSISYPLTGGAMDLSTRATTTRLAGQVTVDAAEEGGDIQ